MTTPAEASSADSRRGDALSIDSLHLEVERALRGSSHCGLRKVRCKCANGTVTLSGEVASFYLKAIAQTIVGRITRVSNIDNQLHVASFDANER